MIRIKDFFYNGKVSYAIVSTVMLIMSVIMALALENIEDNKPEEATVVVTVLVIMAICYISCKYLIRASCYTDKKRGAENRRRWINEGVLEEI